MKKLTLQRITALLLAVVLVISLSACGSSSESSTAESSSESATESSATESSSSSETSTPAGAAEPDENALKIGIPDDATNGGRAIKLLEAAGLITVDPEAGWVPEEKDITSYLYDVQIVPTQANTLPSTLDDYAAATINGTYAVPAGLIPSQDGLLIESQENATVEGENPFVNVIVARSEDKDNEDYKKVVEAYQSDIVGQYVVAKYKETFQPSFDYSDTDMSDDELLDLVDNYESDKEGKTEVTVGVCGSSNEMWNAVQYQLDQNNAGVYITLVEFDAYNLPNEALNSGDIDLNSFQHKAYLKSEVESQGYEIEAIGDTLTAPLTIYSNKYDSIDALKEAAGALGN